MPSLRPTSRLPILGLIVIVGGALGWLLLGFGADRSARISLPDAAGSTVEYLVDHGSKWSRADVERQPAAGWQRWTGDGYLVAAKGEALWLRVTLRNASAVAQHGVIANADYYFLDELEGWSPLRPTGFEGQVKNGGEWAHARTGEAVPLKEKALGGRDVALPVVVPARGECVVYLRARDFFKVFVWPMWWPEQAEFQAAQTRALLAEGISLGGLLALLAYNTALWLRLRLADIGYYALYLGTVAVFVLLTRGFLPALGGRLASPALETSLVVVIALSVFFLTQFARTFLELGRHLPRMDRMARVGAGVTLALAALGWVTPWLERAWTLPLTVMIAAAMHLGLLVAAVQAWRVGVRHARIFMAAFGWLFAGSLSMAVISFGHGVSRASGIVGVMLGSALEMLLLSLAVADRFVQAQQDKVAVQARLVEETEQRRAIEEAYADELAVEVRERTRELEAANADKDRMLTVIGHDLRGPLAGLTQSAELLSAAPAAELEHFVGNTAKLGRQVLLLIEDLVLWARLRTGVSVPHGRHSVRAVVAPVVTLHRTMADRRGIKFTVAVSEGLFVATDLVLAQTLLRNLVANALKFAHSEVVVSAGTLMDAAGTVELTVSDDGPGLPAAVMAGLSAESPALPGMEGGLGLRLCVEIGRALDAKLAVRSVEGKGTEFKFVLPAVATEAPGN